MFIFYSENIVNDIVIIDGDDYKHITRSLRKREGDEIFITDGNGNLYTCSIKELKKQEIYCEIINEASFSKNKRLHIAIGVTKNPARIETFVEKATEIGVDQISFLHFKHSEKSRIKLDRIKRIAISAMKQSGQYFLPALNEIQTVENFIQNITPSSTFYGHMTKEIKSFKDASLNLNEATIIIGPEGHFSKEEVDFFNEAEIQAVTLGPTRLRVETAGIVASSIFLS